MLKYVLALAALFSFSAAVNAQDFRDLVIAPMSVASSNGGSCLAYQDNGATGQFCRSLTNEQQCQNYSTICFWFPKNISGPVYEK
jgi:hypothetical protein